MHFHMMQIQLAMMRISAGLSRKRDAVDACGPTWKMRLTPMMRKKPQPLPANAYLAETAARATPDG